MSSHSDVLTDVERERRFKAAGGAHGASALPAEVTARRPEMLQMVHRLFLLQGAEAIHQAVFCGIESGNGSSLVCANAAVALAGVSAKSVCLVDGDTQSSRLARTLGVEKTVPMARNFPSVTDRCVNLGENLWFAGSHLISDARGGLLHVEELKQRIEELERAFDYLLIDAPGLDESSDGEVLGQLTEGVVLVIEADKTRRTDAARAKSSLDAAGVNLLGSILNGRSFPIPNGLFKML